jgi:hypothetical protein
MPSNRYIGSGSFETVEFPKSVTVSVTSNLVAHGILNVDERKN